MNFKKIYFSILFGFLGTLASWSQLSKVYEYNFDGAIKNVSNKDYKIFVQKEKGLYTLLDEVFFQSKKILGFCLSPLGNEIIMANDDKFELYEAYGADLRKINSLDFEFKAQIKTIVPDSFGKFYYILFENGRLIKLSNKLEIEPLLEDEFISSIDWNKNLNIIYAASRKTLFLLDINNRISKTFVLKDSPSILKTLTEKFEVALGFENGSLIVLNQDLSKINETFKVSNKKITAIAHHIEDPHLFIGNSEGSIYSINTLSKKIDSLKNTESNNIKLSPLFSYSKLSVNEYLISHAEGNNIKIWDIKNFEPDYLEFIENKIEKFKLSFFKIKETENEEAYLSRTNIELTSKIIDLERQRLIDSIAQKFISNPIVLKKENDSLVITQAPYPPVKIHVEKRIIKEYLELSEINFDINKQNGFFIKKLTLLDKLNKSSIIFDPVQIGKVRDSLLSVEVKKKEQEIKAIRIAQEISKQESQLKKDLSSIVQKLKNEGKINEVDLSVNSSLVKEKDSTGAEELNLKIAFISRGIKAGVSALTSDYPPGKYSLFESPSAKTLVEFFLKSTEENLIDYLLDGTRVTFKLTGSTDRSKVLNALPYEGEYGEFKNFPYYDQSSLSGMNLNTDIGIESNSQLGFLRTYSVRDFIENYSDLFDSTKNKFIHYSEESDQLGAEFRKIKIEITIHSIDKLLTLNNTRSNALSDVDIEIPMNKKKVRGYALIIGNEDYASYQSSLDTSQNVPYANRDAASFKNYLTQMYGIAEENIILLMNATYGEMSQNILKFKKLMEFDGSGNQFVFFYSGHGMPHETTNNPYLMPVDISGYTVDQAISLNTLLNDFSSYDYSKCTLIIDACFSGASRSETPLIQVKGVGNKKIKDRVKENSKSKSFVGDDYYVFERSNLNYSNPNLGNQMILYSSSSGEQTSLTDEENKHGLFTYYFLKSLKESKGEIKSLELFENLKKNVSVKSIMNYNKPQTPEVIFGKNIDVNSDYFLR